MAEINSQELKYARILIEASLDPLVTISADGKITDVNNASVTITGVEREELIGSDFLDYFTDPIKAKEVYKEIFAKGFVSNYPLVLKHVNNKLTDVLFNGSVYKDDMGKTLGVVIVARDVTEKKLVDFNLQKSLFEISGYKKALDESSIVAITNKAGIISYVNDNFCKISKYSRQELIGADHRIINSNYHPKEFMKDLWSTISKGEIWRGEIKNKAKDATFYWVDTTIVPFLNEKGNIYQYVSIRTDITAKKLLYQYSLSLIEASRDPLVTINTEGIITDINEAMVIITGETRENLKGSYFKNYFTDIKKATQVCQEVFEKGFVADFPLAIMDGKLTQVMFNGSVFKDDRGIVLGAVIVARDITEQLRTETELKEAKVFAELATSIAEEAKIKAEKASGVAEKATEIAEKASDIAKGALKAKQQFLSNMSHEIRTPMNAIIGFTKVVLKTDLSNKQREYISAIKLSGDALIVLINDILDLAKVDAGKMTFEKMPFKLESSISSMLHLFETKIQEKNLLLKKEFDKNIPEVLIGDPLRLHQIMLNLLSNAVKFTNKGKITLTVKLLSETDDFATIEFAVIDTGIGISESKIDSIFENFQQASSNTTRIFGGTGLGLAIVKQLVLSQGGKINVKSELLEGSTFSFVLDFEKTKIEIADETNFKTAKLFDASKELKNIKVLVVEDMALNQLLMKTLLDEFGFERDIAANGKIAIEKLEKDVFDIVLMDLQMPEMNGFEATEYIRNVLKSDIPIVALTADVTTVDVEKCKAVGMDDYISKPVDEKVLYSKIIALVSKRNSLIENSELKLIGKVNDLDEVSLVKYTDLTYLSEKTKTDSDLLLEMISLYLEQTPPLILTMKQSYNDQDWMQLHSVIHKILPSFSIMGMSKELEVMAKKVLDYAIVQESSEKIHELVEKIEIACFQACKELKIEYSKIKVAKNGN